MASWMVHLRIADLLLDEFKDVEKTEFIVGNIAPDSGVPSEDWSYYIPSTKVSHFRGEDKRIQLEEYIKKYFTDEMQRTYKNTQYSFYLGYLTHLMTDILWQEQIADTCMENHGQEIQEDRQKFIWKMKADWYDLDFLYLLKNPDFRAFKIYKNAIGFQNTYMDIFAEDAFDNRREYIVGFYSEKRENLEREYPYLNEQRMNRFVIETKKAVADWAKEVLINEKVINHIL